MAAWVWWVCLENPKTEDRGHGHKSVVAENCSKKYYLFKKVYWYKARARCDKEITLPERVRTDLGKKLIALRSRESSPLCSADSLSSSSDPESYSSLDWCFQRLPYSLSTER